MTDLHVARAQAIGVAAGVLVGSVLAFAACSSSSGAAADNCANAALDEGELGIDCGGTCSVLCGGAACVDDGACASGKCEASKCTTFTPPGAATATDGKKNNDETDVDCGGKLAPKCADGKACSADTDCATGYCPASKKICAAPRYDDTVKNGDETDIDCGGKTTNSGFKACAEGKTCAADTDCNGACTYLKKCVDTPSCKPHFGGDTCGKGEVGLAGVAHESCCKSLPVAGYTDPRTGKQVTLDKYEITAGRFRAFIEDVTAKQGGKPDVKAWIAANKPPVWNDAWNTFLPSDAEAEAIVVPHQPSNPGEAMPWNRNAGANYQFNGQLFVYVHGHNCYQGPPPSGSYGYPTYWLPPDVMTKNGGKARSDPSDGAKKIDAKEALDVKSMTCVPNVMLVAFCHWDGGQLATDEVLDFVTAAPASLGNTQGCGSRCAPLVSVNATDDSLKVSPNYRFPFYDNATAAKPDSHEGVERIAAPGRVQADVVRIAAADEPWMDLHGNVHEAVLDMNGATFTDKFGLKYRGIGYSSARAIGNPTALTYPEYKAGYTGGRCMRFK